METKDLSLAQLVQLAQRVQRELAHRRRAFLMLIAQQSKLSTKKINDDLHIGAFVYTLPAADWAKYMVALLELRKAEGKSTIIGRWPTLRVIENSFTPAMLQEYHLLFKEPS